MITWMTRQEAADYLRVSPATIDRYARDGRITKYTVAGTRSVRFKVAELNGLLEPEGDDPVDHAGEVREPEWIGDRAPCGCPRQGDLWLCATSGPWTPTCPSWPARMATAAA